MRVVCTVCTHVRLLHDDVVSQWTWLHSVNMFAILFDGVGT